MAIFFALNVHCLRRIRVWRRTQRWGSTLVQAAIILALIKIMPVAVRWAAADIPTHRQRVVERLQLEPEKQHLVIVSYDNEYPICSDWVYNQSDIDGSPIVWARDMGESKNTKLIEYYSDRKVWRFHLENDESMTLRPHVGQADRFQITRHARSTDNHVRE